MIRVTLKKKISIYFTCKLPTYENPMIGIIDFDLSLRS